MKKIFTVLALAMLFSGLAMASDTRIEGLGLNGATIMPIPLKVSGWMVEDNSNVKIFPGTLTKYPKLAVLEYDGDDLDSYLNIDAFGGVVGIYTNYAISATFFSGLTQNFGLLYGFNLSDTMALGLGASYAQRDSKAVGNNTEVPEVKNKDIAVDYFENLLGFSAGLSLLGDMPMDFGVQVALPLNVDDENTDFNVDGKKIAYNIDKLSGLMGMANGKISFGDTSLGLGARYFSVGMENINQAFDTSGTKTMDNYDKMEISLILGNLGVVKTVKAGKITAFAGTQFEVILMNMKEQAPMDKLTETKPSAIVYVDATLLALPILIGAEAELSDNWTVRAGARKSIWNSMTQKEYVKNIDGKIISADDTDSGSDSDDLNLNMGATFKIGAASLDLLVDKDLALSGPQFISGGGTAWSFKTALNFKW